MTTDRELKAGCAHRKVRYEVHMTLLEEAERALDDLYPETIDGVQDLWDEAIRLKAESLAVKEAMNEMDEVVETGWLGPSFYRKALGILHRHLEGVRK